MTLLIIYLSLALGVSFFCSMLEAVLLSVRPAYIAGLRSKKPMLAERLTVMKSDIERPLAAILILNTIAHTVGAAGVGAQAGAVFGSHALGVVSAVLTFLILVFSEIIPKSLGANYWRRLAPFSAQLLRVMIVALYPLVIASRALTRLFGSEGAHPTVSRDELQGLVDVAAQEGITDENESRVLRNLLRFRQLRGHDIMTPRNVVVALDQNITVADAIADERTTAFSRLPIHAGNIDDITGYVLKQDLLAWAAQDQMDTRISELKRDIVALPETAPLPRLFDVMLNEKEHLVLLHEELGGFAGIATLEDVVETLLGLEIVDETDQAVDMRQLARARWEERARAQGKRRGR